jgi:hypothetical protein
VIGCSVWGKEVDLSDWYIASGLPSPLTFPLSTSALYVSQQVPSARLWTVVVPSLRTFLPLSHGVHSVWPVFECF